MQIPIGVQTLGNVLRQDVLPDLKRKKDWQQDWAEFEKQQAIEFEKLLIEKGIKIHA